MKGILALPSTFLSGSVSHFAETLRLKYGMGSTLRVRLSYGIEGHSAHSYSLGSTSSPRLSQKSSRSYRSQHWKPLAGSLTRNTTGDPLDFWQSELCFSSNSRLSMELCPPPLPPFEICCWVSTRGCAFG
ncbi:hypothetical protein BS47DRAFT_141733 [Hydnum rufescens UP504]|uniref:Uncharacterized protein n=1 Tax=Hydnum rufescens UP504 TaxID=1448309 RepID=A0A9P6ARL4_9AGAM|nr:hypothetical protein BS47DRAFT_141733 [Hydnum rufescens UP504]